MASGSGRGPLRGDFQTPRADVGASSTGASASLGEGTPAPESWAFDAPVPPSTDGTPSTAYLERAGAFAARVRAEMTDAVAADPLYHQLAASPSTEAFAASRAREIMEALVESERRGGARARQSAPPSSGHDRAPPPARDSRRHRTSRDVLSTTPPPRALPRRTPPTIDPTTPGPGPGPGPARAQLAPPRTPPPKTPPPKTSPPKTSPPPRRIDPRAPRSPSPNPRPIPHRLASASRRFLPRRSAARPNAAREAPPASETRRVNASASSISASASSTSASSVASTARFARYAAGAHRFRRSSRRQCRRRFRFSSRRSRVSRFGIRTFGTFGFGPGPRRRVGAMDPAIRGWRRRRRRRQCLRARASHARDESRDARGVGIGAPSPRGV